MRRAVSAMVMIGMATLAAGAAWSQTSVLHRSITLNANGSSVTVTGQTVTVDTRASAGRIVGDGQPASETRSIGQVTAIDVDGAFALTVKPGPAPGLTIEADKNLLAIVKTDVTNSRLELYTDRSYSTDWRIKITVTSPNIADISASGSNQITAEGLTGGPLSISLNGSNNAVLSGKISTLTARLSGSNNLTAQQLAADAANVTISGSGAASVDARQRIVAEISGAGSIEVYGNPPARSTQVNGSGKITFVE
jgi:Putative auto-transporter adhesin, head GIN domain